MLRLFVMCPDSIPLPLKFLSPTVAAPVALTVLPDAAETNPQTSELPPILNPPPSEATSAWSEALVGS